jgi:chromate transporter
VGFVLPGVTFILVLALFISNFAEIAVVRHAFTGIRIAVGALILDTVIKLAKGVLKDVKAIIIFIVAFVLSALPKNLLPIPGFMRSPVFLVLTAGLVGFIIYRQKKTAPPQDGQS